MKLFEACLVLAGILSVFGAHPEVKCPVPLSPQNGKLSLTKMGIIIKYSCNPGFLLKGAEKRICKDDKWFPEAPTCEPVETEEALTADVNEVEPEIPPLTDVDEVEPTIPPLTDIDEAEFEMPSSTDIDEVEPEMPSSFDNAGLGVPFSTPRPLFQWDKDDEEVEQVDSIDETDPNDVMQGDEARYRRVIYPRRRVVTPAQIRVRSAASLDEEERKRSSEKPEKPSKPTSLPSVLFVRQPATSGKSWSHQYRVPYHPYQVVDNRQVDEANQRYYYWSSQYPRRAVADYRHPGGLHLSESQWTWINNLQPEVRDRYLKDLYGVRANEVNYLRYADNYPWAYNHPYQVRQPVVAEPDVSKFDYSCYRTERDGRVVRIRAPKLPHASLKRYDRRQNPNHPRNDYLVAQYRCKPGFKLVDSKSSELYCSRSSWVGNLPVCVLNI